MRWSFAILLIASFFAACDDSPSGPADPLAGRYDWVRSTGGLAGQTRSPDADGYTVRLELDGYGRATARRSGAVVATGAYMVEELATQGPLPVRRITFSPPLDAFDFTRLEEVTMSFVSPGVVELADPCCDGWRHTFALLDAR